MLSYSEVTEKVNATIHVNREVNLQECRRQLLYRSGIMSYVIFRLKLTAAYSLLSAFYFILPMLLVLEQTHNIGNNTAYLPQHFDWKRGRSHDCSNGIDAYYSLVELYCTCIIFWKLYYKYLYFMHKCFPSKCQEIKPVYAMWSPRSIYISFKKYNCLIINKFYKILAVCKFSRILWVLVRF